jgi:hypothetical protein
MQGAVLPTTNGHINFFEDLEQVSISRTQLCDTVMNICRQNAIAAAIKASKKADPSETDKGVPLAPSAKDLNPWYSEKHKESHDDEEPDERKCASFTNDKQLKSDACFTETEMLHGNPRTTP